MIFQTSEFYFIVSHP